MPMVFWSFPSLFKDLNMAIKPGLYGVAMDIYRFMDKINFLTVMLGADSMETQNL